MTPLVLHLPTYVCLGKTERAKDWTLNLNFYRNADYRTLNKMKVRFKEMVEDQINRLPKFKNIELTYVLYLEANRGDVNNFCSVVDKFFCDALKELGRIPDDSFKYLKSTRFLFGGVDPSNPRCEAHITGEIEEMETMKIVLDNDEVITAVLAHIGSNRDMIAQAVTSHLAGVVTIPADQRLSVTLRHSKDDGWTATGVLVPNDALGASIAAQETPYATLGQAVLPGAPTPPAEALQALQAALVEERPTSPVEDAPTASEAGSPNSLLGTVSAIQEEVEREEASPAGMFQQTPAAAALFNLPGTATPPAASPAPAAEAPETKPTPEPLFKLNIPKTS